jgi:hypothetical protein
MVETAAKPHHQTYGTHPRSPEESRKIRAWAKDRGLQVNDRGRLPYHVIEEYENREEE